MIRSPISPGRVAVLLLGMLVLLHPVKSNAESAREHANNIDIARDAVVNINTTYFSYSYRNPWNRPVVRRASGTGFIISENRGTNKKSKW